MRLFGALEMWCRRQAAAAVLPLLLVGWLTGESSEALTTFGKSPTQSPYETKAPTAPPARECRQNSECAGIASTSCVRAHDASTRCLCGDNMPPVNGRCSANYRGLRHMCSDASECAEGLVCATPNATETGRYQERQTLCLCDAESGYVEKDHYCSDAEILKTSMFVASIVLVMRKLLA